MVGLEGAAAAEVLVPLELLYADLLLLSSAAPSFSPPEELARLRSLSTAVMDALGPSGPGLLCVTGVPRAAALRHALLPLARKLALLGNTDRTRILKDHGLGSDVPLKNPDRSVSSFAMQLKYDWNLSSESTRSSQTPEDVVNENPIVHVWDGFHASEFKHLGDTVKKLGLCMMEIGLQLAQVCDRAIGGSDLQHSILESCTAKGRLIHYHSTLDNHILKETRRTKGGLQKVGTDITSDNKVIQKLCNENHDEQKESEQLHTENGLVKGQSCKVSLSNLWQQWHYDYGIFTVLSTPLFISSCEARDSSCVSCNRESSLFNGHSYLHLFDANTNKIFAVKPPPESFIIQVGESADILSRGKLRSTLHAVGRPPKVENLSRENFVVFLQPAWGKTLTYSCCPDTETQELSANGNSFSYDTLDDTLSSDVNKYQELHQLMQEIYRKIPPLSSRLREGMTFAEFSRETTKQYYGGSGTQSRRDYDICAGMLTEWVPAAIPVMAFSNVIDSVRLHMLSQPLGSFLALFSMAWTPKPAESSSCLLPYQVTFYKDNLTADLTSYSSGQTGIFPVPSSADALVGYVITVG